MSLATEPPQRLDLALRTNSDQTVGALWISSDGVTPVSIGSASLTMRFSLPPTVWVDGEPQPQPEPTIKEIGADNTAGLALGQAIVTIESTVWSDIEERTGTWDLAAVSTDGVQRCLLRGQFVVEEGITALS